MDNIDSAAMMGLVFGLGLAWACWQAHRQGKDRRDVRLLGASAALSAVGAGLAALF